MTRVDMRGDRAYAAYNMWSKWKFVNSTDGSLPLQKKTPTKKKVSLPALLFDALAATLPALHKRNWQKMF